MSDERPPRAEQQGDGQPENARELEDASGGSALADGDRAEPGRDAGTPARDAGDEPADRAPAR
jgi:hypothetical protein